ncbi:hypothetical protein BKA67DRAFT_647014 [Truncatella angustata]|uniref:Uncharacterized protein n=1 Tax=Truncatella angustata TaxID=152316 RepID=A0A9P8UJ23_9PEZI|nr:uncharacterized protein BKA67DRAFT_647014 [Truncatella angustata]KAH6653024.1 hypothetical protein BKA67DRAFT_647014 [Truncatella angustata]
MVPFIDNRRKYMPLVGVQDVEGAQGIVKESRAASDAGSSGSLLARNTSFDSTSELEKAPQESLTATKKTRLLIFSLAIFFLSLFAVYILRGRLESSCLELMEPWSPLAPFVSYESKQFEWGSCPEDYCGAIQDQRETFWKELWDYGWIGFPRERITQLGKSPDVNWLHLLQSEMNDTLISLPESNEVSEVSHQIHCIGMLRKAIHGEKEHHAGLSDQLERGRYWLHTNHCLLSLKIMIECKADATPVIFEEADDGRSRIGAWTMRDAPRRCKNYDALRNGLKQKPLCSSGCNSDEIYGNVIMESSN